MTKLRLKRTPAEEEERARRKAYKAARKAAKRTRKHLAEDGYGSLDNDGRDVGEGSSQKKRRRETASGAYVDDDEPYGPPPPPTSSYKPDYDAIRAELEEMRFREKMWEAMEDDERLGGIDSRFNDYAHIPDRWARDKHDATDPQYMDDDEYAEWVREGMWKKKHAREYEEQARRDAEKATRKAREKEIKAETSRLEKLTLEHEERRRRERQRQREEEYRDIYEQRWKELLNPQTPDDRPLTFADIPWPLFSAWRPAKRKPSDDTILDPEEITPAAVSSFLLPDADNIDSASTSVKIDEIKRKNRDRLKETLLRFHPDKFEGRFMHRILEKDKSSVSEVMGQVVRVLNVLMSTQS